ncbi:MAG: hypothetical protein IKN63_03030 [Bacilli bacterium]|nr:hypothetical protein [Bacilli bacterium]
MKKRKLINRFFTFLGIKEKEVSPSITERINELKTYRFYLTYILDNNLLGKQINQDELPKQLIITSVKNR